jgi:hypothetical protein
MLALFILTKHQISLIWYTYNAVPVCVNKHYGLSLEIYKKSRAILDPASMFNGTVTRLLEKHPHIETWTVFFLVFNIIFC